MSQKTVLYDKHVEYGGKIVDFAGWQMPVNYGSQVDEHHQVRNDAGMFDVSHMTVVDLNGEGVKAFLRHLLANDVARLKEALGELSDLIEEGDSYALELVGEIKNLLKPFGITEEVRLLESQVDDYEFEKALETYKRISGKLELED